MSKFLSYFKPDSASAVTQQTIVAPTFELRRPSHPAEGYKQDDVLLDPSRLSVFPIGDFRNASAEDINDVKCEVMVNWLHSQQEEKQWLSGDEEEGVVLKKSKGAYASAPASLRTESSMLIEAIAQLNVRVSGVCHSTFVIADICRWP